MNTCASSYKVRSNITAECFNQYVARRCVQARYVDGFSPGKHFHASFHAIADAGCHPSQGTGIIDPQPDPLATSRQVSGQPPANTDVAKVINDFAENIPLERTHAQIVHNTQCPKILNLPLSC